ncbi:hypothetical protein A2U01_0060635, partial [Trifolium medium]|nr:hypothetical protein [Trifolium medium]
INPMNVNGAAEEAAEEYASEDPDRFLAYWLVVALTFDLSTGVFIAGCGVLTTYQSAFHPNCGVFPPPPPSQL